MPSLTDDGAQHGTTPSPFWHFWHFWHFRHFWHSPNRSFLQGRLPAHVVLLSLFPLASLAVSPPTWRSSAATNVLVVGSAGPSKRSKTHRLQAAPPIGMYRPRKLAWRPQAFPSEEGFGGKAWRSWLSSLSGSKVRIFVAGQGQGRRARAGLILEEGGAATTQQPVEPPGVDVGAGGKVDPATWRFST